MNTQEGSKGSKEQEYMSKKVLVNGQFVTLYSINGVTWLSSPEEIPELMARLENARIMLANPEKPEGESQPAKAAPTEAQAPKVVQNKYRMKGPKPRPILKQGGVVIKGTPIEPISASGTVVSFSHDQEAAEEAKTTSKKGRPEALKQKQAAKGKNATPKHIAPVLATSTKVKKEVVPGKVAAKPAGVKVVAASKAKAAAPAKPVVGKVSVAAKATPAKKPVVAERKAAPAKKAVKVKAAKASPKAKSGGKAKTSTSKKKSSR